MPSRPTVIINVAMSLNGKIAGSSGRRVNISSPEDILRVHRLRADVDAILVGASTIILDDPKLLVDRNLVEKGRTPIRVVLDRQLRIGKNARVLDGAARTIIFTQKSADTLGNAEIRTLEGQDLTVERILHELYSIGVRRLLVEGGKHIIHEFLNSCLVDEFYLYIGDVLIEDGGLDLFSPRTEVRDMIAGVSKLGGGILVQLDPVKVNLLGNEWKKQ